MELSIHNLSKTYANGVQALNNVSLTISTGLFGLLGPNGAGKSSLMRTLATLQEPDSGSIMFDTINVLTQKDALRRTLGYLPQDFGVYPKISAESLLDHLAVLKGIMNTSERRELVKALLHKTNLYDVRKKNLGGYSGGMKQRFGIAQALIGNPQLLIMDEPTSGLDPTERNRFLNFLSELSEDRVIILSTHIVEDIKELCTDMAIINKGKVLIQGNPLDLIANLEGEIWRKRIAKDELDAYQAAFHVISDKRVGGKPEIRVFSEFQPDASFEAVPAELEDIYFHTMRSSKAAVMSF